ncbi:replication protein A 70 kDa DNA-binding subunit A, partial [Striga asiatica]
SNMSRKYLMINQVDDEVYGWTVLIQVVERNHVSTSRNEKETKYRRYLLTDVEGTKVSAVTFGANITHFDKKLLPFKRYYISNATVNIAPPMYRVGNYAYSWSLKKGDLVEEYEEPIPPQLPCHIEVTKFADLFKYAETERLQSLSISTKQPTCILINPPMAETTNLKQWYNGNRDFVEESIKACTYKDPNILLPPPADEDILNIGIALSVLKKDQKTAWVQGTLKLAVNQRSMWFSACGICLKSVNTPLGWTIKCPACNQESTVEARCRLGVIICSENANMNAYLIGKEAERLIPLTPLQLKLAEQQGHNKHPEISAAIDGKKVICFVRHYNVDSQVGSSREASTQLTNSDRYSIVKLYTVDEVQARSSIITPDNKKKCISKEKSISNIESGSSSVQTIDPKADKQFFSPTASIILETIAQKVKEETDNLKPAAKRALAFSDAMKTDQTTTTTSKQPQTKESSISSIHNKEITSATHKKPREKNE